MQVSLGTPDKNQVNVSNQVNASDQVDTSDQVNAPNLSSSSKQQEESNNEILSISDDITKLKKSDLPMALSFFR